MKKRSLIILMLILIAALFVGCRRPMPDSTGNGSVPQSTTPATSKKRQDPAITLPAPSDWMPDSSPSPSRDKDIARRRLGPRF